MSAEIQEELLAIKEQYLEVSRQSIPHYTTITISIRALFCS